MKKELLSISLVAVCATATLISCGDSQQETTSATTTESVDPADQPAEEVDTPFATKRFSSERKFKTFRSRVEVDYPVGGNDKLQNSIRNFINKEMGGKYKGDMNDAEALIEFYALRNLDDLKEDLEEGTHCSLEDKFTKVYETDTYVTFNHDAYTYAGDAHPNTNSISKGVTFRKSDGKIFEWDLLNNTAGNEFKQMLKEGLMSYFRDVVDVNLDYNELQEYLLGVDNINDIPLPEGKPYFTNKGLVIHYAAYEIAPYAAGQPEFTIPHTTIKKFIDESAQSFFK